MGDKAQAAGQGLGSGHVPDCPQVRDRVVARAPFSIESWRLMSLRHPGILMRLTGHQGSSTSR